MDQELDTISRLPTLFFPSAAIESLDTVVHHHRRVVIIAYDHSNYGDAMIAKSIKLGVIRSTDNVRILNVVSQEDYRHLFAPMLSGGEATLGIHKSTMDSHLASAADRMITEITDCLRKNGLEHVTPEIMRGDAKQCIVDYCRMKKPAFLITGTRGLGSVKRAVMGSVSQYLVKNCPCPVLVCKLNNSEIEERKKLNDQKQATFANVLAKYMTN